MTFLKDDDLDTGEDLPIHAPQPPKRPKPTSLASTNNSSLIHLNANAQLLSLLARHFWPTPRLGSHLIIVFRCSTSYSRIFSHCNDGPTRKLLMLLVFKLQSS